MKSHSLFFIFVPAIILVLVVLAYSLFTYQRLVIQNQPLPASSEPLQIPIFPDDIIEGSRKAPITLIAFEDLGCEGCAAQDVLLRDLMERHPERIKIVWKPLSVTSIPYPTRLAHEYAFCANEQDAFDEFKRLSFVNRVDLSPETLTLIAQEAGLDTEKLDSCLASGEGTGLLQITEDLAEALQIQAVPAFFINNTQIQPPTTVAGWEAALAL